MSNLDETIYNIHWLKENELKLRELFPTTLTHIQNFKMEAVGFHLKLLGVNWKSIEELAQILTFLTKIGLVQVHGDHHIRVNPDSIFKSDKIYRKDNTDLGPDIIQLGSTYYFLA